MMNELQLVYMCRSITLESLSLSLSLSLVNAGSNLSNLASPYLTPVKLSKKQGTQGRNYHKFIHMTNVCVCVYLQVQQNETLSKEPRNQ